MALGTDLYLAAQTGTYSTTGPSVSLSGGTAFTGFQTLSGAGAVNSSDYYCTIRDSSGNSLVWQATYSSTGPTLTRSAAISAIGSIANSAAVSIYVWSRAQKPTASGLAVMEAADASADVLLTAAPIFANGELEGGDFIGILFGEFPGLASATLPLGVGAASVDFDVGSATALLDAFSNTPQFEFISVVPQRTDLLH